VTAYGGIELGGTKVICAIGSGPGEILAQERFATTTPDETIGRALDFFKRGERVAAVGVAAFGPLDLDPESASYGTVRSTPKRGWQRAPVLALVRAGLDVPVAVDTDVGAAAVGEWRWGAARGVRVAAYVTVGTGIGAGIVVDGHPFHGLGHPEFGHIPAARDPEDELTGVCPVHGDCLEGLASGPAIAARWGRPSEALPADHPAWDLEARYLGRALATLTLTVVPGRIVIGGGVTQGAELYPRIRHEVRASLGGYLDQAPLRGSLEGYIVSPGLGNDSGVLGAIALARRAVGDG